MIGAITRVQLIDHAMADIDLFDSSPSAIGDQLCQILFGANTDRGCLNAKWKIFGDKDYIFSI
jgi:hypothetical protein